MKGAGESVSPPKPFSENLIDIIMIFAERWNMTPFDVMEKDIDDFIIISNYLISQNEEPKEKSIKKTKNKQVRIKSKR